MNDIIDASHLLPRRQIHHFSEEETAFDYLEKDVFNSFIPGEVVLVIARLVKQGRQTRMRSGADFDVRCYLARLGNKRNLFVRDERHSSLTIVTKEVLEFPEAPQYVEHTPRLVFYDYDLYHTPLPKPFAHYLLPTNPYQFGMHHFEPLPAFEVAVGAAAIEELALKEVMLRTHEHGGKGPENEFASWYARAALEIGIITGSAAGKEMVEREHVRVMTELLAIKVRLQYLKADIRRTHANVSDTVLARLISSDNRDTLVDLPRKAQELLKEARALGMATCSELVMVDGLPFHPDEFVVAFEQMFSPIISEKVA